MPAHTRLTDAYVATALARWEVTRHPGQLDLEGPGVHGLLACATDPRIRILVTDDRAHDLLATVLPAARAGIVEVFLAATRCAKLFDGRPTWRSKSVTAMVCRDVHAVPAVPLPGERTFRAVRRLAADPPDAVPLEDAAAAADSRIDGPLDAFVGYLRSLPPAIHLFAAVDADGVVRATSGSGAFGTAATVIFVNTDPDWRGRGIGRAMAAAAPRAAEHRGAEQAGLDATAAGLSIYLRLGFEVVARTTQFFRAG